ncbi:hypothetical protein CCACVL1_28761 [Corchorus capsularis]|uniref:Uncharacterized protein n=1 Tax=Corchorus capsularis TaxID=210143 RepID=A0A1R3G5A2_COCAP|nr:hypothetical protein CCACVL1_28761 [Corchorus capsularis]
MVRKDAGSGDSTTRRSQTQSRAAAFLS